jgi:hypothetical protein
VGRQYPYRQMEPVCAIAAPFNDGAGDNAGHVRIYNVGGENSASDNIEVIALPAVTFTAC